MSDNTGDGWADGTSRYVLLCACGSKTIRQDKDAFVCAQCGAPFGVLLLEKQDIGAGDVVTNGAGWDWSWQ